MLTVIFYTNVWFLFNGYHGQVHNLLSVEMLVRICDGPKLEVGGGVINFVFSY